ncbi:MAG: VWA domain-containing protein [Bacteroidales bacterium]|nr:VWA domain-containing protein [Bacteroidales bacterium]
MKKQFLSLSFILVFSLPLWAQQLPTKINAWVPEYIGKTDGSPLGIGIDETWQHWCERKIKSGDLGKNTKTIWKVWSDRSNNPAYASSSTSSEVVRRLAFGESFFVADVSNGMLLLFSDEYNPTYPKFNKTSKVVGWVPIENLLLYGECPKTQSQIYLKGLIVYDPTKGKSVDKNPEYTLVPGGNLGAGRRAKDLDILFVMKKVSIGGGSYYLLSNSMNCEDRISALYGWLPEEYVTEWSQRLTLEPTHASSAVREYDNIEKKPTAFEEYDRATRFLSSGSIDRLIWVYSDFTTVRQHPYQMRLPILSNTTNDNIFRVAVINNLASNGTSESVKADLDKRLEKLREHQSKINVIFVIDATQSMKKYFASVASALTDVMKRTFFQSANIKVGCVLYRDYKDHEKNGVQYLPCTADLKSVASYLNQVEVGSIDPDDWEAMFDGIEVALDYGKMGYKPEESNFVVLIGDAGNHPTDISGKPWRAIASDLAKRMVTSNINMIAYQINHAGSDAYDDFADQVGVMQNALSKEYERKLKRPEGTMDYKLISNRCYRLMRASTKMDDVPIYNMYRYAAANTSESSSGLTQMISSNIEDFQKWTIGYIDMLEKALNGGIEGAGDLNRDGLLDYLKRNKWTADEINHFISYMKSGGHAKFLAYTSMKIAGKRHDLYDYVLFFSKQELQNLLHELDKVNANNASDKKAYQDALIAMGQAILGNFNANQIGGMTVEELMSQIYGVPIKMQSCGFRIDQIPNLDNAQVQELLKDFRAKLTKLHHIAGNTYDGQFSKNGIIYYWIPLDLMPGYCIK